MKTHNIASFVLRFTQELWQDPEREPHVRWRGHIRHVQGDDERRFTDLAEAITFLQHHLTQLTVDSLSGSGCMSTEKVFAENFKLWQTFATSYTDMMFQTMEQALDHSAVFQEQVRETRKKTLQAWQSSIQPNENELLKAIHDLQAQMQVLANKVEKLENEWQEKKVGENKGN